MTASVAVDGVLGGLLPPDDRGLLYGDGLFETIRCVHGVAPLWARHCERLRQGCQRLALPVPDLDQVQRQLITLCEELPDAVARVTWTRGSGPRGYAPPADVRGRLIVSVAARAADPAPATDGVAVRMCDTRLSSQPRLAGLKHLNRLEQVLARAEWNSPEWGEGLMCDDEGHVVCATAANLFIVRDGALFTPPVDRCGVAGVARAEVLATQPVALRRLTLHDVASADEVFLTSSVRGILPVRQCAGRTWRPGPVTRSLQAQWRAIGLP
jgi:4-amino-4-deoxychorismate lyase